VELEPRSTAPRHAVGAVEYVPLDAIADDVTFRLREEGDVSELAASLGRLGQLIPVELRKLPGAAAEGPRYQLVAGFRRVEALRCLLRERVLARVHDELGDEDAWAIALCEALLREPLDRAALEPLRSRIADVPAAAWACELIDEAHAEGGTVEVTPEELADDLSARMYEVNADLALASEAWEHLPPAGRRAIVDQARYVAAMLPHLKLDDEG
jgi:ParB-like chromosome segregation protein Spo0J